MSNPTNNPNRAGELAGRKSLLGEASRFAIAPVHTRFHAVEWFVWDAERLDELDLPAVVGQVATRSEAEKVVERIEAKDSLRRFWAGSISASVARKAREEVAS